MFLIGISLRQMNMNAPNKELKFLKSLSRDEKIKLVKKIKALIILDGIKGK